MYRNTESFGIRLCESAKSKNSIWLMDCWSFVAVKRRKNDDSKQKDADGVDLAKIKSSLCAMALMRKV